MRIGNSETGYGIVHVAVHWIMAVLIVMTALRGLTMTDLPPLDPSTFEAYNLHKSLGITVLALAVLRLVWRIVHGAPKLPEGMSDLERSLATAAHHALYLLLFLVPLLGWLMSSTAAIPVSWFGMATLPSLMGADEGLKEIFEEAHELAANLLMILVGLHVLAALKHHFISKDNVLRRMIVPAKD